MSHAQRFAMLEALRKLDQEEGIKERQRHRALNELYRRHKKHTA